MSSRASLLIDAPSTLIVEPVQWNPCEIIIASKKPQNPGARTNWKCIGGWKYKSEIAQDNTEQMLANATEVKQMLANYVQVTPTYTSLLEISEELDPSQHPYVLFVEGKYFTFYLRDHDLLHVFQQQDTLDSWLPPYMQWSTSPTSEFEILLLKATPSQLQHTESQLQNVQTHLSMHEINISHLLDQQETKLQDQINKLKIEVLAQQAELQIQSSNIQKYQSRFYQVSLITIAILLVWFAYKKRKKSNPFIS